jgi:sporulation protein YlmC with PRC-barrel domain
MFRTSASALLISTALITGSALSQTGSAPGTAAPSGSATPAVATPGQFMTEQAMGQYRASKFIGINIYGTDNQRIGDINEVLMDGSGSAKAVVIGVGGFLGIGEKNVAVPFSAVEWVNAPMRGVTGTAAGTGMTGGTGTAGSTGMATTGAGTTTTTGTGTATTGTGIVTGTGAGTTATSGGTAATMGSTTAGPGSATTAGSINGNAGTRPTGMAATTSQRSPDEMAAYNGYPDHGVLRMSKADLQNAPAFRYYSELNSASGAQSNASTAPMSGPAGTPRQ